MLTVRGRRPEPEDGLRTCGHDVNLSIRLKRRHLGRSAGKLRSRYVRKTRAPRFDQALAGGPASRRDM